MHIEGVAVAIDPAVPMPVRDKITALHWLARLSGVESTESDEIFAIYSTYFKKCWEIGDDQMVLSFSPKASNNKDTEGNIFQYRLRHFRHRLFALALRDGRLECAREAIILNTDELEEIRKRVLEFCTPRQSTGYTSTSPFAFEFVMGRIHKLHDTLQIAAREDARRMFEKVGQHPSNYWMETTNLRSEMRYFVERLQMILMVFDQNLHQQQTRRGN